MAISNVAALYWITFNHLNHVKSEQTVKPVAEVMCIKTFFCVYTYMCYDFKMCLNQQIY